MIKYSKYIGIGLIVMSFLLWFFIPFIAALPVGLGTKGIITGIVIVVTEIFFWCGGIITGKEVLKKFNLFEKLRNLIMKRSE